MVKELTSGEVARYAGIQTSAVRYYESVGLLPAPKRVNGHRRYDPNVLKRLGLIQLVRQAGFGILELQVLFSDPNPNEPGSTRWQTLAAEKIAEMDALIERTQATRAWLVEALQSNCKGVEDCVGITIDETGNSFDVILSCENSPLNNTPGTHKSAKLTTMQLPPSKLQF
jgi:MerR family transcriptional regulator, redox-sensitive transcriptional activator SoxR